MPLPALNSRPIVCYVTDRHSLDVPPGTDLEAALLERLREAASAQVDWIQIREKDLGSRALLDLARHAIGMSHTVSQIDSLAAPDACIAVTKSPRAERNPVRILINDRLDVACAAHAAGVHLGETSLPVGEVVKSAACWKRAAQREDFLVGVSCHSVEAGRAAARAGADYVYFGPVFATPSKARFGPPQGLPLLAEVCRGVTIPVIAVGGITAENAAACLEAGAAGIAAIRLFQQTGAAAAVAQIKNLR